jgi:uncharacterized protein DUF6785/uncharacterized protein DUF6784
VARGQALLSGRRYGDARFSNGPVEPLSGVAAEMTIRSVLIGMFLGVGIVMYGYFNDWILTQDPVASGMIPTSVYGLLVLSLLLLHPLLRLSRRLNFRSSEWAVIIALMLIAVVLPGPGFLWHFSQAVTMPHQNMVSETGWKRFQVLDYAPECLLVDAGENGSDQYVHVINDLRNGLRGPGRPVSVSDVPWEAWRGPLGFWLPMVALLNVACICIVLIIHRQWAHSERLRYPVAEFAGELLAGSGERAWPTVFYNHRFWLGFTPVFVVLMINGFSAWEPGMITVPLQFDFTAILQKWPKLNAIPDLSTQILRPRVVFIVIGFAYFISTEASLSLGISALAFSMCWYLLYRIGITPRGHYLLGGVEGSQKFGSYLGVGLMILYTGRKYYTSVLLRALHIRRGDQVETHAVWAARGLVVCTAGAAMLAHYMVGLAWPLAILCVLLLLMMFLVIARILVETGLFSIHVWWHPVGVLTGLFGFGALGPHMMLALGMISAVLTIEPRVTMVAMASNALRIAENKGIRPGRIAPWMVVTIVVAVVVGIPFTIYVQYTHGIIDPGWSGSVASTLPYEVLIQKLQTFYGDKTGWETFRWGQIRPDPEFMWSAGAGLALVLLCSVMRLRHTWWPLHPILFLVWGTWPLAVLASSFLMGWGIKMLINRFGGGKAYRANKPLFVGLVAGEFAAITCWAIWGLVYYGWTGVAGPRFWSHP